MPRPPAPGTRDRILDVASRLFYEHGVRAVGMNQVVTEAGTGKNLLYRHFPTKTDLVAAYLTGAAERRSAATRRALDAAGEDPREQLVALVEEVATAMARYGRGCAFRNYLAEFPDDADLDADAPAGVAQGHLAGARATIVRLVGELGVDDEEALVEELWLILDGLFQQAAYRDRLDRHLGVDAAVRLARRLVAGPAPLRSASDVGTLR